MNPGKTSKKSNGTLKKATVSTTAKALHHLAFDNSLQANIITIASNGRIIIVNAAACKLLGYSKKELLTKNRADIFVIRESSVKTMLKQGAANGQTTNLVTATKKLGTPIPCEITSAVFMDEDGIKKAIITIADMRQNILKHKESNIQKEKIVAENIILAKTKQKEIDVKKEKIVAENIALAKSEQKEIDIQNEKIVANNIDLAKTKQKEIDVKKEKIVADNIALAKSEQKEIDIQNEKIVANNIDLAKTKQKEIDVKKEKIVAENIALAKSEQKEINIQNEKIVADNIDLAKTKQKEIDVKKEKIVAENIALVKTKQKEIDVKKEKIVAENIALVKTKQKEIDVKREKIVADNIALAKSKQKEIDEKKEKTVADNIILAQAESDNRFGENSTWIKHIAKTSYDVMWDWDIVTGKVYIGDSIEEVFGYKLQNNTIGLVDLNKSLLMGETNIVQEKLEKALASRKKNWSDTYLIKRNDGSVASVVSRASIVRDEEGNAIRLIGATQDVSRLRELEKKLEEQTILQEEQTEKFFLTAKISFDVIWDWNILTNELFMGDGFEELFGYALKNNKGNMADWGNHLHPDDKEAVEQGLLNAISSPATHWAHAYRLIRADGSIAKVSDRASIIRHSDGKAYRMIGAIQDISRQKELEEKLETVLATKGKLRTDYNESFKLIFHSSSDVLFDCDLLTGEVVISDAYEKEFGYKIIPNMKPAKDWIDHIHPDDKEMVAKDYLRAIASDETEWKYKYRFLRADSSVAKVVSSVVILRDTGGIAYRLMGSMHDIGKRTILEDRLEQEIKLKEKQIADATEDAKAAERSNIGKELHDNVNQLLAVSKLYVDMAKQGGANSELYLSRCSEYTLKAIEEIRTLSKGLTTDIIKNLGLCEAIETIARDTMEVNPIKIVLALENFIERSVNNKFKLNVFRIVQEQLNNILKHAKASNVIITLSQNKEITTLIISDNGVGFDTCKKRKGIGVDNIKSRTAAYNGIADFVSQPGEGCALNVTFPFTDVLLPEN